MPPDLFPVFGTVAVYVVSYLWCLGRDVWADIRDERQSELDSMETTMTALNRELRSLNDRVLGFDEGGRLPPGVTVNVMEQEVEKVGGWEDLPPSSICSDAEWNEIAYGPHSTYSLTQEAIEDLDRELRGDQIRARNMADAMIYEATAKSREILNVWKIKAEEQEYDELMDWMKEGSMGTYESLSTYEQRKLLGRRLS